MIPVIDLQQGCVVHAIRGERESYRRLRLPTGTEAEAGAVAPIVQVLLARSRSAVLYVADLDAIQGGAVQIDVIARLLESWPALTLWLDAGFADRSAAQAAQAPLGALAARCRPVFGSESLATPAALAELADDPQAILSLDSRAGRPLDLAGCWRQPALWPATVIVMTLDRVGSAEGPDLTALAEARAQAGPSARDRCWVGAGGVRRPADLARAGAAGADAWLVATALHADAFDEKGGSG